MLASTRVVLEIGFKYYELKILLSFIINLVMHKVRRTISSAPYCDTEFSFTSLFSLEMNTSHTTRDEHILSGCIFTNDKARCNTSTAKPEHTARHQLTHLLGTSQLLSTGQHTHIRTIIVLSHNSRFYPKNTIFSNTSGTCTNFCLPHILMKEHFYHQE